ncbi:MAG: hypothetical protein WDW38_007549 [Sanguina aurantia]
MPGKEDEGDEGEIDEEIEEIEVQPPVAKGKRRILRQRSRRRLEGADTEDDGGQRWIAGIHTLENPVVDRTSIDFTDLDDEEFQSWLVDEELQQKVKAGVAGRSVGSEAAVEEGKLLGLDDSAFGPGRAFRGREFWR